MPVKAPPRRHYTNKKPNKHFLKVYWPYLPLVVSIALSLFVGFILKPRVNGSSTLAYSTNMSIDGLLAETNKQRTQNGKNVLKINEQLNRAAQAKAEDMAKGNYWAHVGPDGKQPWFFFEQSGYSYQKAGENLAYGFDTYFGAVNGWMNSPSHRDNLLDNSFMDVGFGIANMANYQNNGPQTIVVAHYGRPLVIVEDDTVASVPGESNPLQFDDSGSPVNADQSARPKSISLAQAITGGRAAWASSFVLGSVIGGLVVYLLAKHGLRLRKAFASSERFILHHPLLDATIVSFIVLGVLLSQTSGVIR